MHQLPHHVEVVGRGVLGHRLAKQPPGTAAQLEQPAAVVVGQPGLLQTSPQIGDHQLPAPPVRLVDQPHEGPVKLRYVLPVVGKVGSAGPPGHIGADRPGEPLDPPDIQGLGGGQAPIDPILTHLGIPPDLPQGPEQDGVQRLLALLVQQGLFGQNIGGVFLKDLRRRAGEQGGREADGQIPGYGGMAVEQIQAVVPQRAGAGAAQAVRQGVGQPYTGKDGIALLVGELVEVLHVSVGPAPEVQHGG